MGVVPRVLPDIQIAWRPPDDPARLGLLVEHQPPLADLPRPGQRKLARMEI